MILCICRGVTDREVLEAIRGGASTLDEVSAHCDGAGTHCGICLDDIERHLAGRRPASRAA